MKLKLNSNLFQAIIATVLLAVVMLLPQQAMAQTTNNKAQCDALREQFSNAGGSEVVGSLPEFCSTGQIYSTFLSGAMYAVGIVAVIAVIYGGYLYMTASGNENQKTKAKSVLTWAVIGLVVVILAAVVVNVVIRLIVENQFV